MGFPWTRLVLSILAAACFEMPAHATAFVPAHYSKPDGALVLLTDGNYVEPYFATKALLTAQDAGLDVRSVALAWINWVLPRQRKDGRIDRYCLTAAGTWKRCAHADADDSMLALWLQLLYRMAPDSGLPAEWQESAVRAQHHLASLRNRRLGVYHISHGNHVALLMDNVEVYSALCDVAAAQARFGDREAAENTAAAARQLAAAIEKIFWDKRAQYFRVSIQKERRESFYPFAVAQAFPLLAGLSQDPQAAWEQWRNTYGADWLEERQDPHPWGLLAMLALKLNDTKTTVCWLSQSEPFRYSQRWNVLEEAVYQGIDSRFAEDRRTRLTACSEVLAER
jgi:hypothetical protein